MSQVLTRPTRRRVAVLVAVLALALGLAGVVRPVQASRAAGPVAKVQPDAQVRSNGVAPAAHKPQTVTFDGYSFKVDGKRTYLWSGEFHYFRLPSPDLWLDIFQKMKAAGFNATSLYFDWGYHSSAPGKYDFTGVRNVDLLLDMAQQAGLYVIARPAPYINAEVDGGGLPGWLTTKDEKNRSDDPKFLAYADEWLTRIDRIIARHQLTNGTGSVIAYQVENEYYKSDADSRAYMKHLEDKARADKITVPLTGNNNGTFNEGTGKLDVDGPDAYPQGFDCSNPTKWSGVPDLSYDHPAGRPLYTPEFQGGAFDPWGGPGYDKCAQLINDQFANVFYKQNIAVGATAQSFYMTYGGTNWGWLGEPQNYTSYDYGAAIRETRQLDPKFDQDKLIGLFTQSVAPLTKTEPMATTPPDNAAIVDTGRINPDDGTQFHVLRHGDSTSTAKDTTHISVDLDAKPSADVTYTYDDPDAALQYSGTWSHVANQSYTGGDYKQTESFSNVKGDSLTVPFTGTAVRWIGPKTDNHGLADVYLDGAKVATVDDAGGQNQAVVFSKSGLTDGAHTLKIVVVGSHSSGSTDNFVSVDAIDVPKDGTSTEPTYPTVPQQPGTAIDLDGRDSHILLANYAFGHQQLRYSTSELMTQATIGGRDVAVLYGNKTSDGETVLHYAKRPRVTSAGGAVATTWDAARKELRLNYTHSGLQRVEISGGGTRPLLLLLADKPTAETFWRQDTSAGPVLVRGAHLLRTATAHGNTVALTGDNGTSNKIEVFGTARRVTWNGKAVTTRTTATGSLSGTIPTAAPVTLPALDDWKQQAESPEAAASFDDSSWVVADKTTTNSVTGISSLPVLYADDYGFHTGNTWYRGRFRTTGKETGVHLVSDSGGKAQAFTVWLNGRFLGSSTDGSGDFAFPSGSLRATGGDNVISVLTVNMGHEEDYNSTNGNKAARGLTSASLTGAPLSSVTWRVQGVRGGETLIDPTRGPLSTGGLYGERAGWDLPGYPDSSWKAATLPAKSNRAGVTWYRDDVTLNLPKGQDTSVGLNIADDPSRKYRATLFVNGWQVGNYVNYLGPQHSFPVPNGILNPNGRNTIAIAAWNLDGSTGGLGTVTLVNYGSYSSSLKVRQNTSPGYSRSKYAMPAAAGTAVSLRVPGAAAGSTPFTATATVRVPAAGTRVTDLRTTLSVPAGWSARATTPTTAATLRPGQTATARWTVTPSAKPAQASALKATARYVQRGKRAVNSDERIVGYVPPVPTAGTTAVSDLPFLASSNGWGPVERDRSVNDQAAGDGNPLRVAGTTYAKGLGTNSLSDVSVYLGGTCSTFTASVGVDDETNGAGTVTFAVRGDGRTLASTGTLRGKQAAVAVSADVTGVQVLDLVVGDAGDGNGNDHGDWLTPTLTCTG